MTTIPTNAMRAQPRTLKTLEKTLVIANPASSGGRGEIERVERWIEGQPNCTLKLTEYPGDVIRFIQQGLVSNVRRFVVAGGDGTIHEAVSLLALREPAKYTLGILPMGTGNDLARTLGIPLDFEEAAQVLRDGRRQTIDLIRLTVNDRETHYIVNAAAGGVVERVSGSVNPAYKSTLGPLAYVVAAAGVLRRVPKYRVTVSIDGQDFTAMTPTVVIANGRTAGGGHPVAPNACIDDGVAEAIVATPRTRLEQLKLLLRLEVAKHLDSDYVIHRSGRTITLASNPPMPFSLDGERCDAFSHGRFEVLERAISVLVPQGGSPAARPPANAAAASAPSGRSCPTCGQQVD